MARYIKITPLLKRAAFNRGYYPTYAGFGVTAFLLGLYICDWKYVGKHIPIWNERWANSKDE